MACLLFCSLPLPQGAGSSQVNPLDERPSPLAYIYDIVTIRACMGAGGKASFLEGAARVGQARPGLGQGRATMRAGDGLGRGVRWSRMGRRLGPGLPLGTGAQGPAGAPTSRPTGLGRLRAGRGNCLPCRRAEPGTRRRQRPRRRRGHPAPRTRGSGTPATAATPSPSRRGQTHPVRPAPGAAPPHGRRAGRRRARRRGSVPWVVGT